MQADPDILAEILNSLNKKGFCAIRAISLEDLSRRLERFPDRSQTSRVLPSRGTAVVAAFPYTRIDDPDELSHPDDPQVRIAPFARRHYYREAVLRMKEIITEICENSLLSKSAFSLFSNSRLPEKAIAVAAGLGFYGKNTLVITEETGSRFILAGMITPLSIPVRDFSAHPEHPGSHCGDCSLCIESCPTSALDGKGGLDRSKCLQSLATEYMVLPPAIAEKWGNRLYGCDLCQAPCPFNRSPIFDSPPIIGELGPSLSMRKILESGLRDETRTILQGSALGLSWMNPKVFVRNTLLTAGTIHDKRLNPLIRQYLDHDDPVLRETARQVLEGW